MPFHLAPVLVLSTLKIAAGYMEGRKKAAAKPSVACRICGTPIRGEYRMTKCCGAPLCSDRCVRGYVAASIDGCIFHA